MRHDSVIYLVSKTVQYDELGNAVEVESERMIYANEMSVSMKEFYEAGNKGIRPEKQFEIYSFEYEGESLLKHDDNDYKIIRTQKFGDKTRLICERVI